MTNKRILLTGATGFLGSHIAEELVLGDYELLLTKRNYSDLWRCDSFVNAVKWINTDNYDWQNIVKEFMPEVIINAAWDGVEAEGREQWQRQISNISYQQYLLDIALECGTKKIIGIGSQAEYGQFLGVVDEEDPTIPNSAYGATKLASLQVLRTFCQVNDIHWCWFRIFSVFGERESKNWLIPSVIANMLSENSMELTDCEQQYSYLYVKDLVKVFSRVIEKTVPNGIYNLCANDTRKLREILEIIRLRVKPEFKLLFGAKPYRKGQSMTTQGDTRKLKEYITVIDDSNFEQKLMNTIESYIQIKQ